MGEKGNVAAELASLDTMATSAAPELGAPSQSLGAADAPPAAGRSAQSAAAAADAPPAWDSSADAADSPPPMAPSTEALDAVPLETLQQSPEAMNVWFAAYLRGREARERKAGSDEVDPPSTVASEA